jgi:hypothetical protein
VRAIVSLRKGPAWAETGHSLRRVVEAVSMFGISTKARRFAQGRPHRIELLGSDFKIILTEERER